MIDQNGYRPNVGMVICNDTDHVLWAKRIKQNAYQFPQGGINKGESPDQALFRELYEEVGLEEKQVRVLGRTRSWLYYNVPASWSSRSPSRYRGQKQIWFLLRLLGHDNDINLHLGEKPEFQSWLWQPYWIEHDAVVWFKRQVYAAALSELSYFLNADRTNNGAALPKVPAAWQALVNGTRPLEAH